MTTEQKLLDHEYQIRELKIIITDTNEQVKETSKSVSLLATNVGKLDVVLEKMANMSDNYTTSNGRAVVRMDTMEKDITVLKASDISINKDVESIDNRVQSLEGYFTKGVLAVLTAIGMSLLGMVLK